MSKWQPIETADLSEDADNVLVWDGKTVGEAQVREDYGLWDGDSVDIPKSWAWSHRSTCSCCHSFMDPQPTKWRPMPKPPIV